MCQVCEFDNEEIFINLHAHTAFSLLDGLTKPEDFVNKIKKNRQVGFAVTEHGNVFSAVKMYELAKKNSLKFIYGCEFYIAKGSRFEKNGYNHLTVLAKNEQGRLNINKLVSIGYLEGFYYKPRIDFELLKQHNEGLIVLSGCMASELQQALAGGKIGDSAIEIIDGNIERAKEVVRKFRQVFGEDYYLEVQSHRDDRQQKLNRAIVDIAKEMGIQWVVTADSHFAEPDDFELHNIFIQIGQNREAGETYNDTQLQTEIEAWNLLTSLTEEERNISIRNTRHILDKCNSHIPLSAPLIPHVEVPKGFNSEEDYLRHLCNEGWKRRGIGNLPREKRNQYRQRLMYEFNAITEMGFTGYYLLVESYANSVKRRGIARGSGGGSLVAYLLNIVDIDPIEYGLYFERFIDVGALDLLKEGKIKPEELKIPDFDLDFGRLDREKVVKSIENKYTKEHFASLGQFGYIWGKSAIKDVGRVLGIPFQETNQMTKDLNDLNIADARDEGYISKWEKKYPKLFEYAEKLEGMPRSFGVHPCGKIISINKLLHYHAVLENDGQLVFQMDMDDAESLGLVKIDALGLRTVDVIYDVLDSIGKDYDYINPKLINFNDPNVLEVFSNGWTDGVFQFESRGMRSTLKKMGVTGLEDLIVVNALYRPGAMKYIDTYINRKHGIESFEYLHPDLEEILNNTYGIIVYQEQLIEIGRLAGMRNPDQIRKATAKKKPELMAVVEPELKSGLINRGWKKEQVDQLWEDILAFSKYSFNRSHSASYAIIAYICAFLKVYHPVEFISALFNSYEESNQNKWDNLQKTFIEAKRLGVEVESPSFENISSICQPIDGKVIYGISLLKFCNRQMADELKSIRNNNHKSFIDVLVDIENSRIDRRQTDVAIRIDVFSQFGKKEALLDIFENFQNGKGIKYDKKHKDKTKDKRIALLKEYEKEALNNKYQKITPYQHIMFEKEYFGFAKTTYSSSKLNNRDFLVIDIDKKKTPKVTIYNLRKGETTVLKIKKNKFYDINGMDSILVGDVIRIKKTHVEGAWRTDENGNWYQEASIPESYIDSCSIIHREQKTA